MLSTGVPTRPVGTLLADLSAQVPGVIFQLRRDTRGRFRIPFVSNRVGEVCERGAGRLTAHASVALAHCHRADAARVMQSLRTSAADLSLWQETFRRSPQRSPASAHRRTAT